MRQQQELLLPGDLAEGEEHCTGHFLLSPYMARSVATACTLLLVAQDLSRSCMLCRPVREAPSAAGPPGAGAAGCHMRALRPPCSGMPGLPVLREPPWGCPASSTLDRPCHPANRQWPTAYVAGGHERDSGGI
jgi:hypothetical protein